MPEEIPTSSSCACNSSGLFHARCRILTQLFGRFFKHQALIVQHAPNLPNLILVTTAGTVNFFKAHIVVRMLQVGARERMTGQEPLVLI